MPTLPTGERMPSGGVFPLISAVRAQALLTSWEAEEEEEEGAHDCQGVSFHRRRAEMAAAWCCLGLQEV